MGEQLAHPARVELAEGLEGRLGLGRGTDHDLASVGGVLVADQEAERRRGRSTTPGRGRGRDPEPSRKLGHPELTGGDDEVQRLGLGHRQVDEVQLGGVARHQAMHQAVEHGEEAIEVGIGMSARASV